MSGKTEDVAPESVEPVEPEAKGGQQSAGHPGLLPWQAEPAPLQFWKGESRGYYSARAVEIAVNQMGSELQAVEENGSRFYRIETVDQMNAVMDRIDAHRRDVVEQKRRNREVAKLQKSAQEVSEALLFLRELGTEQEGKTLEDAAHGFVNWNEEFEAIQSLKKTVTERIASDGNRYDYRAEYAEAMRLITVVYTKVVEMFVSELTELAADVGMEEVAEKKVAEARLQPEFPNKIAVLFTTRLNLRTNAGARYRFEVVEEEQARADAERREFGSHKPSVRRGRAAAREKFSSYGSAMRKR